MLEDNHEDIITKALRGQGVGKSAIAERANVERSVIDRILRGEVLEDVIACIAPVLGLSAEKLLISARKEWSPKPVELTGLKRFESDFGEMSVNAYIVYEQDSRKAWIFDTGTDCNSLISFIEEDGLKVDSILLTHTHRDHIYCLDKLKRKFPSANIYVHKDESIEQATQTEEGFQLSLHSLKLFALHTHGHSAGGLTYLIEGLPCPVAIVGDALFAGSMGGGMVSYQDALQTNREKIMTLPDNCVLCPGHGPMTTVGEEKKYNPFFPEF